MNFFKKYLEKLTHPEYYKIVFHLIKTLLYSLSRIHYLNIGHQNINDNSILVSSFIKPDEIKVKYTDFGLGCYETNNKPLVSLTDYEKHKTQEKTNSGMVRCKDSMNVPVDIDENIMAKLTNRDYLDIIDRKSTRLNSSHTDISRMPSSA